MHFVYRTTNTINGRYYIGAHTGTLSDSYLGSGKLLTRAVKLYGKSAFTRIILEVVNTLDELYAREQHYIELFKNDPLCYNIHPGGRGGWAHINIAGLNKGEGNAMKRRDVVEKVRNALKRSIAEDPEGWARRSRENGKKAAATALCRKLTDSGRKTLSESASRRWKEHHDEIRDSLSSSFRVYGPDGDINETRRLEEFCAARNLPYTSLWNTSRTGKTLSKGRGKGWRCEKI